MLNSLHRAGPAGQPRHKTFTTKQISACCQDSRLAKDSKARRTDSIPHPPLRFLLYLLFPRLTLIRMVNCSASSMCNLSTPEPDSGKRTGGCHHPKPSSSGGLTSLSASGYNGSRPTRKIWPLHPEVQKGKTLPCSLPEDGIALRAATHWDERMWPSPQWPAINESLKQPPHSWDSNHISCWFFT